VNVNKPEIYAKGAWRELKTHASVWKHMNNVENINEYPCTEEEM
jgi:hypothetical protein